MPDKHNGHNWFDTGSRRGAWASYRAVVDIGGSFSEALAAARQFLEARGLSEEEVQVILDELFTGPDPENPP